jgi:peptidylprolyl isomerase
MKIVFIVIIIAAVAYYFYNSANNQKNSVVNQEQGSVFLAENAKKDGVKTTASGLQYQVLQQGSGDRHPTATSTVRVHYHGTLINGTVFDSSVERGETISFPLNRVIAGWTEGVQLMKVGDKFRFFIPSGLGYGNRSTGKIPAGSVLIFDVELFEIQ